MKRSLLLLLVTLVISCKGNENSEVQNPQALQEKTVIRSLSKRNTNLIEELYSELTEKIPELKNLETELEMLEDTSTETQNIFYRYDQKSTQFYTDAKIFTNQIKDSVSRKKILDLIKISNEKYTAKSKQINALVKEISTSNNSIQSRYFKNHFNNSFN